MGQHRDHHRMSMTFYKEAFKYGDVNTRYEHEVYCDEVTNIEMVPPMLRNNPQIQDLIDRHDIWRILLQFGDKGVITSRINDEIPLVHPESNPACDVFKQATELNMLQLFVRSKDGEITKKIALLTKHMAVQSRPFSEYHGKRSGKPV